MSTKQVLFICPLCSQKNKVPVPEDLIKSKGSGATTIFVPKGTTCDHEYYAYVDTHFTVRDYLTLDYVGGNVSFESKKQEIYSKMENFNSDLSQIYKFINAKDFRCLMFAAFLEHPIIFIENDLDEDRFKLPFSLICKVFPQQIDRIFIYSPEKYLEFSEKNEDSIKNYVVYNIVFKLLIQKPFFERNAEHFQPIIDILMKRQGTTMKIQSVIAKNTIDYLKKFACEVEFAKDKPDSLLKKLRKAYPRQAEMLNDQTLQLMREYRPNEYPLVTYKPGVDSLHQ